MGNQQPNNSNNGIIYKYTSPSGKSYIGQTKNSIEERRGNSKGNYYRGSKVFYSAIKKYGGLQNFKCEILEDNIPIDKLDEKERFYIKKFKTTTPFGYNVLIGGQGEDRRFAIRRGVCQYDEDGLLLGQYDSIEEAALQIGCSWNCIYHSLHGETKTGFGYYWFFSEETPKIEKSNYRRRVYEYDRNGIFIQRFESCKDSDLANGYTTGSTANAANPKCRRKSVKGRFYSYEFLGSTTTAFSR